MKILWFTNTPSKYDQGKHFYHGGGWIESLEELVSEENSIELAISFFHKEGFEKQKIANTTYYPILRKSQKRSPVKAVWDGLFGRIESEKIIIPKLLNVIEDFKPDVIQVFGTEEIFASIQKYIDIPVVIHLQGLIIPYLNAYFPPNHSTSSFFLSKKFFFKNLVGRGVLASFIQFKNRAVREKMHLFNAKNIMGRTNWDYSISKIYAPNSQYFHIEEVLRKPFYNLEEKKYKTIETLQIISTLSETIYKGIDVLLKSAKLLKEETNIDFQWIVIGIDQENDLLKYFTRTLKINPSQINIKFIGKKNADELVLFLQNADLFIHPSYIDNSPNSVCEAQIVGTPVIACNVGGLSTLIEDNVTGVLVPANGIFEIVSIIIDYDRKADKYFEIGQKAREFAKKRHNTKNILDDLLEVYTKLKKND